MPSAEPEVAHADALVQRLLSPRMAAQWLVAMRWHIVVAQISGLLVAWLLFRLDLPFGALAACIGVTAATNLVLHLRLRKAMEVSRSLLGAVLLLDTGILTVELALTGGTANPLAGLLLVYVLAAAVFLEKSWIIAIVASTILGFAVLLLAPIHRFELPNTDWLALATVTFVTVVSGSLAAGAARATRVLYRSMLQAHEHASRSERLASLTTLAAGAAHELATPLGSIAISAGELEALVISSPTEAAAEARIIREQVERCRRVLSRMSTRIGTSVGELPQQVTVNRVVELLRAELGKRASRVQVSIESPDSTIAVPVEGLVSVLTNLVDNAFDASGPSHKVELKVEDGDNNVRFLVIDQGRGFPKAVLSRLGEPFVTTKPPGAGMGLGLFLVRTFAQSCGGELTIVKSGGGGTTIGIDLPRRVKAA